MLHVYNSAIEKYGMAGDKCSYIQASQARVSSYSCPTITFQNAGWNVSIPCWIIPPSRGPDLQTLVMWTMEDTLTSSDHLLVLFRSTEQFCSFRHLIFKLYERSSSTESKAAALTMADLNLAKTISYVTRTSAEHAMAQPSYSFYYSQNSPKAYDS